MAYSDDTESNIIVPKKWYEKLPREAWSKYEKVDQPDQWFEVYKLTDSVYAIYEDGQFEEVISYLVLGEEKGIIIDTGNGIGNIKAIIEGITELPVIVLNTHTHGDHIGGNYQFDEVYVFDCNVVVVHLILQNMSGRGLRRPILFPKQLHRLLGNLTGYNQSLVELTLFLTNVFCNAYWPLAKDRRIDSLQRAE